MIGTNRVLGLITARGGSKGIPRKNIRLLGGRPLIAWTIEAARASVHIDRLVLSTDDAEIRAVAEAWGCEVPFMRPSELATDTAGSIDVVRHALTALAEHYDYLVLLQPTSPLRTATDIDSSIRLCVDHQTSTCVTVCEVDKTPYWMFVVSEDGHLAPLFPAAAIPQSRQAAPKVYMLNGAVFVAKTTHIMSGGTFIAKDTFANVMSRQNSIDIDTEEDLANLEMKMGRENV